MTVAYLDTSALVKLIRTEPESAALREWLSTAGSGLQRASSAITWVELVRACARSSPEDVQVATAQLRRVAKVAISDGVIARAATLEPPGLRSLDALHLATAMTLGSSLTAFVAYDKRLVDAAGRANLTVVTP